MHGDRSQPVDTSVIIVTYNNRADIDACLQSVQAQSDGAEIIVVDNLSTDGTLDHIRQSYPTVRAVSAGRNSGFGAGVNIGAMMASGAYLAVINPDTEVPAGWLAPLIEALQQPGVGLATPTILLMDDEERVNACGNDVHLTGLAFCAGLNRPAPALDAPNRPVAAVSGAAFALRRSLWEELGGFDERFFMYLEDTDLSLRARRMGYGILHVPASRVWHHYVVRVSTTKLYHLELNRLLMLHKNLSPATLAILAPALALTEAITWAFCARRGKEYLAAKWRSYRQWWSVIHTESLHTKAVRDSDRTLLRGFSTRLATEQVTSSAPVTAANLALTAFYALWRAIALASVTESTERR